MYIYIFIYICIYIFSYTWQIIPISHILTIVRSAFQLSVQAAKTLDEALAAVTLGRCEAWIPWFRRWISWQSKAIVNHPQMPKVLLRYQWKQWKFLEVLFSILERGCKRPYGAFREVMGVPWMIQSSVTILVYITHVQKPSYTPLSSSPLLSPWLSPVYPYNRDYTIKIGEIIVRWSLVPTAFWSHDLCHPTICKW